MSSKIFLVICVQLVLALGQEKGVNPSPTRAVKETIYDINLYISIPASVIALGLMLCLCYCLMGSCRDGDQRSSQAFQPVIVTNRNSPLVVSAQSSSRNDGGSQAVSGSVTRHQDTNRTERTAPNQKAVQKNAVQKNVVQKNAVPPNKPKLETKAGEQQTINPVPTVQSTGTDAEAASVPKSNGKTPMNSCVSPSNVHSVAEEEPKVDALIQ